MKTEKIKNILEKCPDIFEFEYQGKDGNVDHYYVRETKTCEYLLYFDGEEQIVYDVESAMNTPFVMGKSLNEIANEIEFDESYYDISYWS